jgi:tetratricopeptide (TPR) repeat protein
MNKIITLFLFFMLAIPFPSSGQTLHDEQLNKGIRNSDPYAYLLIRKADSGSYDRDKLLREALMYSPDLPAVYFELSKASFSLKPENVFESTDYLLQGILAYKRNFWWTFMMAASLLTSLILAFFFAVLIVLFLRLPRDFSLLSHDIREVKAKALLLLILIFALAGPLYFVGALLIITGLYVKKWDKIAVYLYLLFLLISPLVFKTFSLIFDAPASGELKAVVQVNEGKGNRYALSVLGDSENPVELFAYALALKREGRTREAINVYKKIPGFEQKPLMYNNLANSYLALNDVEKAKELYQKSAQLQPRPSVFYNLSQAYRETLNFDRGEEYFLKAQKLDNDAVLSFRRISGRNPNRFVVDESLPVSDLLKYVLGKTENISTMGLSSVPPIAMPFIALLMAILFVFLDKSLKNRAYRCNRCGKILCGICEKHLIWMNMCLQCYRSLIKLDELDAKERIARLLAVYEHQQKRRTVIKVLSFILPGTGQIYAGSILPGLLILWLFLFLLFIPFTNMIFTVKMSGFSHFWLNLVSFFSLVLIYIISNVVTRRRLAKGWL